MSERRQRSGASAQARGVGAETIAATALQSRGWEVLGRRVRTAAGEIDLVARRGGMLVFVEVKARPALADAAAALGTRQRARLLAAAEIWLAEHPGEGAEGVRFDVMLVDATGQVRRIRDAFRGD